VTTRPPAPLAPWQHFIRRALPAYWIFLFCVTHFPRLALPATPVRSDWLAHAVAYGLLALLLWKFVESFRPRLGPHFAWAAAALLAAYAALDELTQPLAGRSAEFGDWLADMLGVAVVLALLEWRRRTRPAARRNMEPPPPGPV
jgi:VanZ family protein